MTDGSVLYLDDLEHERWLQEQGLQKFADPSVLVPRVEERRARGDDGIQSPWSKLQGLFSIPLRGVTLLGGYSGSNKSTLANQWALHAANTGHRVAIASLELPADYVFEMLAEQGACVPTPHAPYLTEFANWLDNKLYLYDTTDVVTPEDVFRMVDTAKQLLGVDLLVLDCLMQVSLSVEMEAEKAFITKLSAMARDYEMAILIVHHVRKPAGNMGEHHKPTKSDFLGSSHLVNSAAAVLTLWRSPDVHIARQNGLEPSDPNEPDFLLSVQKSRFQPWHGSCGLYMHEKARVLCATKHRKYQPINLKEEKHDRLSVASSTGPRNPLVPE